MNLRVRLMSPDHTQITIQLYVFLKLTDPRPKQRVQNESGRRGDCFPAQRRYLLEKPQSAAYFPVSSWINFPMYLEWQVRFQNLKSSLLLSHLLWSYNIVSTNFPHNLSLSLALRTERKFYSPERTVTKGKHSGSAARLRPNSAATDNEVNFRFTVRASTFPRNNLTLLKMTSSPSARRVQQHEIQLMHPFQWVHILRFNFLTLGNTWQNPSPQRGGGPASVGVSQGPSNRLGFLESQIIQH